MEANVDYPVDCHITSSDMVIILANLLDNAIEACSKIENSSERKIRLVIRRINAMVMIKVENPCPQAPEVVGGKLMTNKKNKYDYGWGRVNVEDTAQKYEGSLRCTYDNESKVFFSAVNLVCRYDRT